MKAVVDVQKQLKTLSNSEESQQERGQLKQKSHEGFLWLFCVCSETQQSLTVKSLRPGVQKSRLKSHIFHLWTVLTWL